MPLRKSHLYSSLWKSCDELRGGMAASQYKDYVLTLLFMKYVSDKYADDDEFADIRVPPGGSFADMVALKGSTSTSPSQILRSPTRPGPTASTRPTTSTAASNTGTSEVIAQ